MEHVQSIVEPGKKFAKDSIRLVKKCTKPDRKEYQKIAFATAVGFAIMGFIGFFVKLIHIPINEMSHDQTTLPHLYICISGKRKSGKDYFAKKLASILESGRLFPSTETFQTYVSVCGVSYPLKEEFAEYHKLDAEKLKSDGEYKETVRKQMVIFGEKKRTQDPGYFCRKALEAVYREWANHPTPKSSMAVRIVIVSDCRRPSDLEFFKKGFTSIPPILVRVDASLNVREKRGFIFTDGIDNAETECALDDFNSWDARVVNDGDEYLASEFLKIEDLIRQRLGLSNIFSFEKKY
ncbi:phosphomevalonate kinase domain-containing protein [Ditylenchus destructor]|uniref:Phosphomevalonate kinase n=1 Tax=Ditylenchus destructor TaxID=166010 RepID=A0AAD4NGH3_9BILA|nr:phosphomevalonate kinase domain-containing protein [Ditylenchus destructor]